MTNRRLALLSLLAILGLLLGSVYLQVYANMQPCPLCALQRCTFILLGIVFFLQLCFYRQRWQRLCLSMSTSLLASLGMLLAGRQIWLQTFMSSTATDCGASLEYMLQVFSWNEVLTKVFAGSTDCAKVEWIFLYLNMAQWAFIWFMIFFLVALYSLWQEFKR